MSFREFDAGAGERSEHAAGIDCQVRALVSARNMTYHKAWSLLTELQGERRTYAHDLCASLDAGEPLLGCKRALDTEGMNAGFFAQRHPTGNFILSMHEHVAAVVDGVLLDTWDCSAEPVTGAWEICPIRPPSASMLARIRGSMRGHYQTQRGER